MIDHVIWDWNGTLLDDVEVSIEAMNRVLERYGLARLDRERYRDIFCFPVRDYYAKAGFDFTRVDFEKPAMEFIEEYYSLVSAAGLSRGAAEALDGFLESGIRQVILSASERESLIGQVRRLGIENRFTDILGIDNHFAASKAELAQKWISENNIDKSGVVFIGDTLHDLEVAAAAGCACVLVSCGHQSEAVLKAAAGSVAGDIEEAAGMAQRLKIGV
ncbi:MAG: HAD family hydrolase [Oscillospiraceae bacterium]|nr:HAD family hydrolase [Oscillospiraceae bacterium]